MPLPRAEDAIVDEAKLRDYLLSHEHPVGRAKARFFESLGFHHSEWQLLGEALRELALHAEATPTTPSVFGQPYLVRGILRGPEGRSAGVVTVWMVPIEDSTPRLITAYPTRR